MCVGITSDQLHNASSLHCVRELYQMRVKKRDEHQMCRESSDSNIYYVLHIGNIGSESQAPCYNCHHINDRVIMRLQCSFFYLFN